MNPDRIAVANRTSGWLHPGEGEALNRYAIDGPFVELGSFAGKSTVWLGDAAEREATVLFAVDWHRGSPEMAEDRECHRPEAIDPRTGRHDTLPLLRATLEDAGLEDVVVPVVGSTETVGRYWSTPVGFLFIDACHGEQVQADWLAWGQHVESRVAFHDSEIPAIQAAINMARDEGFRIIDTVRSLTVMER